MFKKITAKLILFIILTGLIPLLSFSTYSILKSHDTTMQTAIEGNKKIAEQMAGRITQYLQNAQMILIFLSENINRYDFTQEQLENILRKSTLNFDEFNFLRVIDTSGSVEATSEIADTEKNYSSAPEFIEAMAGKQYVSDVYMTQDMIPAVILSLPVKSMNNIEHVLVAELDLLHLWKLIEELKIGKEGYLNILTKEGKIFATGDGATKIAAIQMANYADYPLLNSTESSFERKSGKKNLVVVSAKLPPPYLWTVTVEQPTSEAYALSRSLSQKLIVMVAAFAAVLFFIGWMIGKNVLLKPINKLMTRIREIGRGKLDGTVTITGKTEFALLGNTLNDMSHQLISIQDELVKKEKQALLGQIASGLAHDLKHPIASIENYTRLLEEKYDDPDYRQLFLRTVKREFEKTHIFLNNLIDYSKEIPFHPVRASLNQVIEDIIVAHKPEFEKQGIEIICRIPCEIVMDFDLFAFQRVMTNLMRNAKDAMPKGGKLTIEVSKEDNRVKIEVSDTGTGIRKEQLEKLFENFKSTKRNGLGLGLAIVQKIIKQHQGEIVVSSEFGSGTCFTLYFPLTK